MSASLDGSGGGQRPLGGLLEAVDYRRLLAAQVVSGLGDWLGTVALMALVFDITGSAVAVGGMLALRLGPGAIAGPLGAQVARRLDRRRTMLAMDLVRATVLVAIPLIHNVAWVLVWVFVLELATLVYLPARDALIPDLVERDHLRFANGLVLGGQYGTLPLGAGLFALFAALAGDWWSSLPGGRLGPVFFADALTFIASFSLISGITSPGRRGEGGEDRTRFRDGLRIPLVQSALIPVAGVSAGLGTVFSLGIVFVEETLGAGDAQFATLIFLFGVGGLMGLGLLQLRPAGAPFRDVRSGVLALGLILALLGLAPNIALTFVSAIIFGAAAIFSIAAAVSGLQLALSERERVLTFAAFHIAVRVALGVGAVVAGGVADSLQRLGNPDPVRTVLAGSGAFVALGVVIVWGRLGGATSFEDP